MIDIQDKNKYLSDNASFSWTVRFPALNLTYNNDDIPCETFSLTESLCDKDSLEFVGCIASKCQVSLYDVEYDLKGQRMTVMLDDIPMFDGIVDSVEIQTPSLQKKITAYDKLYSISEVDVTNWYNGLSFPRTLKQIRESLLTHLGLSYETADLPADNMIVAKEYDPKSLNGLTCLKAICQLNGCCGIINRYGKFEFRYVKAAVKGLYPSDHTFPGPNVFPGGAAGTNKFSVGYYESMKFQEYFVNPVTKVQIRPTDQDNGVIEGSGNNKYIIQANMWAKNVSKASLQIIAKGILKKLKRVTFHPCNIKGDGLPFLEVGDVVEYPVNVDMVDGGNYDVNIFMIMTRTFSGTQFLRDTFTARGQENQSLFITDLQTQIETIKQNGGGGLDPSNYYDKEDIDDMFQNYTTDVVEDKIDTAVSEMETPTGLAFASVYVLPNAPRADTLYGLTGGVILL